MAQSFLEVARELIDSPAAKTDYAEDPDGFLTARGLEGLTAADLEAAVGFVAEAVPAPVARQLALDAPGTAPDPAALARLAAVTEVEAEVREAEPGSLELGAVIDPGGELGIPDSVEVTRFAPAQVEADEGEADAAGAEPSNPEESDIVELPEGEEAVIVEAELAETTGTDETDEPDEETDDEFELDPELQPTVDPESDSDAGLPASGAVTPAAEVDVPPEETFEDLI